MEHRSSPLTPPPPEPTKEPDAATARMRPKACVVSTGRLRYWEGGSQHSTVVLLLHSAYGNAPFSWSPVWEDLAKRHRVISPDMPGFGDSQAPGRMDLTTLARALRELLDQLGVARATVVGNSFGVSAALALAALHPERVERLVLVNGTTLPSVSRWIERATTIPMLDRAISAMFYRAIFGHKSIRGSFPHASPEELHDIFARIDRAGPANFETVKACVLNSKPCNPSVNAKVSLLWGADDRFTPLEVAHRLCKVIPGAELVVIERAGHLPQWDQPREFLDRLLLAIV